MSAAAPQPPVLSIVVPLAAGADAGPLLRSLRQQDGWELIAVGPEGGAPDEQVTRVPIDRDAPLAASLEAGRLAAHGEFVTFLQPTDSLPENAMADIRELLASDEQLDLFYTDERIGDGPAVLKPVWSPERLRSQFYLGSMTAYRRSLLAQIGGILADRPGAELYDLALRASIPARSIGHLASIVVVRQREHALDDTALESTRVALEEHLAATGGGRVDSVSASGAHATHRDVAGQPLVSVIIPTRGDSAEVRGSRRVLVVEAVRSVIERTSYTNFEFVIVIDDVAPPAVREELERIAGDRIRFVGWDAPFSFSGKMNLGVVHSRGEFLLFLNDDTEVISAEWMTALVALGQRPGAGVAGALLYFEDETIQHAGHAYYRADVTHIGLNSPRGAAGPGNAFLVEREVDGATAACSLMPRAVFFEAGGFSTLLPGNFNDVDLCMKVAALGYRAYVTPRAELYHYESKTRNPRVARYEIETAWGRWEHLFWDSKYWPDDPHIVYPA